MTLHELGNFVRFYCAIYEKYTFIVWILATLFLFLLIIAYIIGWKQGEISEMVGQTKELFDKTEKEVREEMKQDICDECRANKKDRRTEDKR